ncbi:amidohydrolase 2, partial [Aureobasidium melanogenum]
MVPPLITLEEHYLSQNVRQHLADTGRQDPYAQFPAPLIDKLTSLGSDRLAALDSGNVSLQILSHSPLNASPQECRTTNDNLAAAIKDQPRYAAFALLPMATPSDAAAELERCVKQHKFVGALINNHCNGTFYDGEAFRPVFAKAEELGVPIYIHPTFAADEWMPHYRGNFGEKAAQMMSIAAWGWHSETGLHVLRLWASGLFDEFPKLKIIIGHMGEMLPYQLDRIISTSASWAPDNKRSLETVWKENFWITTSGMFSLAPLACLLRMCAKDRILYSVDYPFSGNEKGLKFIEDVEASGMVSKEDLELICYKNAEKLLGVKAVQ